MFLLDLRHRIQRHLSDRTVHLASKQQQSDAVARQHRAEHVRRLQGDIHRMQLEIARLSQMGSGDTTFGAEGEYGAQIARLQDELTQIQLTLAKFQGRV